MNASTFPISLPNQSVAWATVHSGPSHASGSVVVVVVGGSVVVGGGSVVLVVVGAPVVVVASGAVAGGGSESAGPGEENRDAAHGLLGHWVGSFGGPGLQALRNELVGCTRRAGCVLRRSTSGPGVRVRR